MLFYFDCLFCKETFMNKTIKLVPLGCIQFAPQMIWTSVYSCWLYLPKTIIRFFCLFFSRYSATCITCFCIACYLWSNESCLIICHRQLFIFIFLWKAKVSGDLLRSLFFYIKIIFLHFYIFIVSCSFLILLLFLISQRLLLGYAVYFIPFLLLLLQNC